MLPRCAGTSLLPMRSTRRKFPVLSVIVLSFLEFGVSGATAVGGPAGVLLVQVQVEQRHVDVVGVAVGVLAFELLGGDHQQLATLPAVGGGTGQDARLPLGVPTSPGVATAGGEPGPVLLAHSAYS